MKVVVYEHKKFKDKSEKIIIVKTVMCNTSTQVHKYTSGLSHTTYKKKNKIYIFF